MTLVITMVAAAGLGVLNSLMPELVLPLSILIGCTMISLAIENRTKH